MSITPDHIGYEQMVEMIGAKLMAAIPDGAGALGINSLLNTAVHLVREGSPSYRQEQLALSITFLIGEAGRMGVNLDDLARHCQQLATVHEKVFFNARD